jgi:porphobilinogen deaminase
MAFLPECGEGIMGIFGQEKNKYQNWFLPHFHHTTTEVLFQAEMAFQREMGKNGDYNCFGFATSIADSLSLTAGIVGENGEYLLRNSLEGQIFEPEKIGKSLAFRILENL